MPTPKLFEQATGGVASPDTINQWLSTFAPPNVNEKDFFNRPSTAWLAAVQSVLKGSDVLRHMQIDAIHNARQRTSHLARSLAHTNDPMVAGKAWQQFSQDNLQNTLEYWNAYREIMQDTEIGMLTHTEHVMIKNVPDQEPQARRVKPAVRKNTTRTRTRH